ncbi:hypothetical protein L209DRAFT_480573 [Thermothelomyces heterothallicus CBS 203.75]
MTSSYVSKSRYAGARVMPHLALLGSNAPSSEVAGPPTSSLPARQLAGQLPILDGCKRPGLGYLRFCCLTASGPRKKNKYGVHYKISGSSRHPQSHLTATG